MVWKFITITLSKDYRCFFGRLLTNCPQFIVIFVLAAAVHACITTISIVQSSSNDFEELSMSEDEALLAIFSSTPTDLVVNLSENTGTGNAATPLTLHDVLFWYYQPTGGPCSSSVETNTFIQDT